jgi:asparagine synthase (glutamine-hydrolysing)
MAGKKSGFKKFSRMSYLKLDGLKGIYLFLRGHFTPYEIAQQLGAYENDVWKCLDELPNIVQIDQFNDKNTASWMEFNLYMQNQLLRDADIMGMRHGVEIRVPFLDDAVVRMANKIESKIKYKGKLPKQFLIDTFHHRMPREIWDRPKMGFSFPFAQWLSKNSYAKQLMMEGNNLSQKKYKSFTEGKLHWSHLMTLIIMNHRNVI